MHDRPLAAANAHLRGRAMHRNNRGEEHVAQPDPALRGVDHLTAGSIPGTHIGLVPHPRRFVPRRGTTPGDTKGPRLNASETDLASVPVGPGNPQMQRQNGRFVLPQRGMDDLGEARSLGNDAQLSRRGSIGRNRMSEAQNHPGRWSQRQRDRDNLGRARWRGRGKSSEGHRFRPHFPHKG